MVRRRTCLLVATVALISSCQRPEPEGATLVTAAPVTDSTVERTSATTVAPVDSTTPETSVDSTVPATSVPATSAPATSSPVGTVPPSSSPVATTSPPTTVAPAPGSPADLVLAFDGIRPLLFGDADGDIVSTLTDLLGAPISDESTDYATPDEGRFVNELLEEAFVAPFGRSVCFSNGLCAQFGAGSATALQFIGWDLNGDDAAGLATDDGITVGSRWVDHADAIVADEGGCFNVGYGSADGIDVIMESDGEPFVTVTDGEFEFGDPDPADVTIVGLSAGDLSIQLFADC